MRSIAMGFASGALPSHDHVPFRVRVVYSGLSDIGRRRQRNEDAYIALPQSGLFAVADGIGGVAGGEVAARILVETLECAFETRSDASQEPCDEASREQLLLRSLATANAEIRAEARRSLYKRMGTTFAGVLVSNDRVMIAHVGDSRVYRHRGKRLEVLTQDHTMWNDLLRGRGSVSDIRPDSIYRNVLARAVGLDEGVDVDTRIDVVGARDTYLICTDGVHGVLQDDEIASILEAHGDPLLAVQELIQAANERGGPDNITAIAIRFSGWPSYEEVPTPSPR
jgi:serine/threonine protein phosphatase PrpC